MAYVVPVAPAVTFGRGSPIYGTAVHPSGLIGIAPIRVLVSPFEKRVKAAVQRVQPWIGRPDLLSTEQLRRTGYLALAAKEAEGTYGTEVDAVTGRLMPKIAIKVRETLEGKGLTYTAEERAKRRRLFALRYRRKKQATALHAAYLAKLEKVIPEAAKAIREQIAAGIPEITYITKSW